ncbi:MAG: adenylate/guanylate cyclase domain-containing protein [Proteobacteria bacterium]|nr:adenylate/guanylate cyclase domain-containing protein [Pseudomonadota bacterium]
MNDFTIKSSTRLWRLVEERTRPGADVAAIDARIWSLFGDDWAVMATDLSGFSRNVAKFGITHFLQIIHEQQRLLVPVIEAHDGIVVKSEADSFLLLFKTVPSAVTAALAMQQTCAKVNARRHVEEQIILCLGIGYGRVLKIGDEDVFGHEVNLASKLGEDIARGGEVLLTPGARAALADIDRPTPPISTLTWDEVAHEYVGEKAYFRARY